jgi:hypothetical protein
MRTVNENSDTWFSFLMHPVTQAGYGVAPGNQQIPKTYKPQPARKVPVIEDFEPVKTGPVIRVTTIWSFRDRRAAERFFQRLLRREGKADRYRQAKELRGCASNDADFARNLSQMVEA